MAAKRPLSALVLSFFASLTAACSPLVLLDPLVPDSGYTRTEGIPYGPGARQKLDVYRPKAALKSTAVIVFLYGGSWKSGSRQHYRFVGQSLASAGYVVVIPDYRLYPEVRFPRFVEDAAEAIAWVHRAFPKREGHSAKIVLAGHSAGAHIAALLALDPSFLNKSGVPESSIAGLVGLAGPYGFDPLQYSSIRPIFETAQDPDTARPITFARAGAPPTLLMHGLEDWTVGERNSSELAQRLRNEGASVRYIPLEKVGHRGILLALSSPFRNYAPVMETIVEFIEGVDRRYSADEGSSHGASRNILSVR